MDKKLATKDYSSILVEEFDFTDERAKEALQRLEGQPDVYKAFEGWIDNRTDLPELEVEGFTLNGLVDTYGMRPVGAFLALAWLKSDPEEAKKALKEGHDDIEMLVRKGVRC